MEVIMFLKKSLSAALVAMFLLSGVAFADQPSRQGTDWGAVQSVAPGQKIVVETRDGKKSEGRLRAVSDTSVTIDRSNRAVEFDRANISKVHRKVSKSVGKSTTKAALVGAGIGFGAGAGVALAAGQYEDLETGALIGILGGICAAIGAGVGAAFGAAFGSGSRKELIYQSK
jgi:small nuclear ribonucleoprotein (snRNP)-like protein